MTVAVAQRGKSVLVRLDGEGDGSALVIEPESGYYGEPMYEPSIVSWGYWNDEVDPVLGAAAEAMCADLTAAGVRIPWDPTKHPRHPAGSPQGGEFRPSYYGVRMARENNEEHGRGIGYVAYHMQPGASKTDFTTTDVGPVRGTYQEALKDAHAAIEAEAAAAPRTIAGGPFATDFPPGELDPKGDVTFWPRKIGHYDGEPYWKALLDRDGKEIAFWFTDDRGRPHHQIMAKSFGIDPYDVHFGTETPAGIGDVPDDSVDPEGHEELARRHRKDIDDARQMTKALAAAASEAQLETARTRGREQRAFGRTPWDESKHPRHPAGTEAGGEFRPKGILVDWGSARAEFDKWTTDMAQWYTEKEGFPPDYFPTQAAETWRQYVESVNAELVPLRARLDEAGVSGVTIRPQLSSAAGGDLDAIMDPERQHSPDFDVSMRADPEAHPSDRPGFSLWTFPPPDEDVVEDIIPLDDTSFFPGGPESDTAAGYVRLLDAAANRPVSHEPVTIYRGMSDAEIDAWEAGEEIPAGKFFTSTPTTAYAQDIDRQPPTLQQFQIPRDMLVEVGPGEFQLKKRARMKAGKIEAVTGAAWAETKHPRHPKGSEKGGEFRPKLDSPYPLAPKLEGEEKDAALAEREAFVKALEEKHGVTSPSATLPETGNAEMDAFLARQFEESMRAIGLHGEAERRARAEAAGTFVRHSDDTVFADERVHDFTDDYLNELADEMEFELEDGDPNELADVMDEELARAATFQENARSAFDAIAKVHTIPASADEIELTLNPSLGNNTWGEHYAETYMPPEASLPPLMRSRSIKLNPTKDPAEAAGTMTHEFGHYMDVQIGDGTGWFSDSEDGAALRDALHRSEAVKTLKRYREQDPVYVDYLLGNQEMFARAYAQWVARESGDAKLLESVRHSGDMGGLPERQWDDVDFGPIAAQFDKLFERWRD